MSANENSSIISLDLHNHSIYSYDGKLTLDDFLENSVVDVFAVTDHNDFRFHENYSDGKTFYRIDTKWFITGEEIMTSDAGEVIGLFIKNKIEPHLPFNETLDEIKKQNGIVYLPHPYDLYRKGKPKLSVVKRYMHMVDIIEVFNAKYFTNFEVKMSYRLARRFNKMKGYGSDAHKRDDLGKGYVVLKYDPTKDINKEILLNLLKDEANIVETVEIRRNFFKTLLKRLR